VHAEVPWQSNTMHLDPGLKKTHHSSSLWPKDAITSCATVPLPSIPLKGQLTLARQLAARAHLLVLLHQSTGDGSQPCQLKCLHVVLGWECNARHVLAAAGWLAGWLAGWPA
jgi:hypothetical protein